MDTYVTKYDSTDIWDKKVIICTFFIYIVHLIDEKYNVAFSSEAVIYIQVTVLIFKESFYALCNLLLTFTSNLNFVRVYVCFIIWH